MRTFSVKERLGACILDGPRFLRAWAAPEGWRNLRNRADRIELNPAGAGVRCDWEFTRSLHFCDVYPAVGGWLLRRALQTDPIRLQAAPDQVGPNQVCWNGAGTDASAAGPDVSFLIGHRGRERLPHLLTTLESIAAQTGVTFECVVVEQDAVPRVRAALPSWVKWVHTPAPPDLPYCRSWAFNVAARLARAPLLVCHDNDMLVPERYASDLLAHFREGYEVVDLKRFIFYLAENSGALRPALTGTGRLRVETVIQNLRGGGSVAIGRSAFEAIGGFDEAFVGWGGEDNEFWDRCRTRKVWEFTRLPLIHLWHAPQPGKRYAAGQGRDTGDLFQRLHAIPPETRSGHLRAQPRGDPAVPPAGPGAAVQRLPGLVSTIIPVHNRAALLREAVASVLAQTYRPVEILIVDDGSTDDTGTVADVLAAEQPGLIRVLHAPNGGPGAAREAGRQAARGEFIQYLDSDDFLLPHKFELQVAALRARPECGLAYGATGLTDAAGRVLQSPYKWTAQERAGLFPGLLVDRWWNTHTPLWRHALCDRIGAWSSLRYSEDWEYEARAGALKPRLAQVPEVVAMTRRHAGSRETTSGRWLAPADQVSFFETLWTSAVSAGVEAAAPEMRHFARWVFAAARAAGRAGDAAAARRLFALFRRARGGWSAEALSYRCLAAVAGWRWAAVLVELGRRWRGRGPGPETLKQSWMEPS